MIPLMSLHPCYITRSIILDCCQFPGRLFASKMSILLYFVRREWWRQGFQKLRDRAGEHFSIRAQSIFLPLHVLGWAPGLIDTPRLEDSAAVGNLPYFDGNPIRPGSVGIPDLNEIFYFLFCPWRVNVSLDGNMRLDEWNNQSAKLTALMRCANPSSALTFKGYARTSHTLNKRRRVMRRFCFAKISYNSSTSSLHNHALPSEPSHTPTRRSRWRMF